MSRFDSTIFRSKRRVVGVTVLVAAGVAAVTTPALAYGGGLTAVELASSSTPVQHGVYTPDPNGLGGESVYVPTPSTASPAAASPAAEADMTNDTERASRSNSRHSLSSNRPSGSSHAGSSPQATAQAMLAARGWSGQFGCLNSLWNKESGWSVSAANPSGAYGIPQALPGSKMATAGSDWQTNPATQITWGLNYIASTYGSPCNAWAHSQADNWY